MIGSLFRAKVAHKVTMHRRHFMVAGKRTLPDGRVIQVRAVDVHRGQKGEWVDLEPARNTVLVSAWGYLWTRIRQEFANILNFLRGRI